MRILIISNLYPPRVLGGYEIAARDLAVALSERGHEVRVLTTPMEQAPVHEGPVVNRILGLKTFGAVPPTTLPVLKYLHFEAAVSQVDNSLILLSQLEDFQPDHVMAFSLVGLGGIGLIDVLQRWGAHWSLNLGDRLPQALTEGISLPVLAEFGVDPATFLEDIPFVSVSNTLVREIEADGIALSANRLVIARGIRVSDDGDSADARDSPPRFVFTGSLSEHKGVDIVLEAMALLSTTYDEFSVDFFGDGDREHYRGRATELGVGDKARFHGQVERSVILASLSRATAFLFPTAEREPLGQAPLQAAAMGCVPIITAQAGVAEWLSDGAHCVKIDRTPESLADAMSGILSGDIDAEGLGRRAKSYLRTELSFDSYVLAVEGFIVTCGDAPRERRRSPFELAGASILDTDRRAQSILHTQLAQESESQ